jgi:hypothetical protein
MGWLDSILCITEDAMIDYDTVFIYTDGGLFPDTKAINASAPAAQDGTEFVKAFVDDLWGFNQALMDHAGLVPSGVAEAAGASQRLEAIQRIVAGPGEIVEWNLKDDPATVGRRRLLLNGQGVLVGDGNNAAVAAAGGAYYRADDAAGTIPNIAGVYLILPESRGYAPRGLDPAATVDPQGASRYLGDLQEDAFQGHWHNIQASGGQVLVDGDATGPSVFGRNGSWGGIVSDLTVETTSPVTDGVNGTPRTSSETRMSNRSTKWAVIY